MCLFAWIFAGCATYRAMPLTPQAVAKALQAPNPKDLILAAAKIKHPLLKSVKLDLADGISPDEAAILAVLLNTDLRVQRDALGIARAQVLQAGILPNPRISAGMDLPVGGRTAGTTIPYSVGLGFDLRRLIQRGALKDAARFRLRQVNMTIAWQEVQVAFAARQTIYRLIATKAGARLQQGVVSRLEKNLETVQAAVGKGLMTGLDLAAAQTALNTANADLLVLKKRQEQQSLRLKRLIGLPPGFKLTVQTGIKLPLYVAPPVPSAIFKGIEARRLDIMAMKYGYQSQEANVRTAILGQFPNISIGVNHARDNSDYFSAGIGISVELPIFDHNQGRIAIRRATRKRLFDEYTARLFQARAGIARLVSMISWLDLQIKQVQQNLPQLEHLLNIYKTALDQGQADILTYYATWNQLARQQIRMINIQQALVEAKTALALVAGYYNLPQQKVKK